MTDAARGMFQRSLGTPGDHACETVPIQVQGFFPDELKDDRDATRGIPCVDAVAT